MKIFTIFCQEANGLGTVHIDVIRALDLETAIQKGKKQCLEAWSSGSCGEEDLWSLDDIHCLGVAAGNVEILHWEDLCDI